MAIQESKQKNSYSGLDCLICFFVILQLPDIARVFLGPAKKSMSRTVSEKTFYIEIIDWVKCADLHSLKLTACPWKWWLSERFISHFPGHSRFISGRRFSSPFSFGKPSNSHGMPRMPRRLLPRYDNAKKMEPGKNRWKLMYPWKINMEPENDGLEDDFPFQLGDFRFHVNLLGWIRHRLKHGNGKFAHPHHFH